MLKFLNLHSLKFKLLMNSSELSVGMLVSGSMIMVSVLKVGFFSVFTMTGLWIMVDLVSWGSLVTTPSN